MTGTELTILMKNGKLKHAICKHARRYSSLIEDQEEYIQEAWFRIAQQDNGLGLEFYEKEALRAIRNTYERYRYSVGKKKPQNPNGNSIEGKRDSRKYLDIGRGKYINKKYETLDGWYYREEWRDWLYFVGDKAKDGFSNYCILKRDADYYEIEYTKKNLIDKSFRKTYRVHNIEVDN